MVLIKKEAPQTDAVEKRTGHKCNGKLGKDRKKELGASAVLALEKAKECIDRANALKEKASMEEKSQDEDDEDEGGPLKAVLENKKERTKRDREARETTERLSGRPTNTAIGMTFASVESSPTSVNTFRIRDQPVRASSR